MKKIYGLITFLLCLGCYDLDYEGGERMLFEGKVINENGEPLSGISIKAIAELDPNEESTNYSSYDSDIISVSKTDEKGNFKLMFPNPTNETQMKLIVNYGDYNSYDNTNYSRVNYYNIQDETFNDYTVGFNEIELFSRSSLITLNLQFIYNEGDVELLGWNLEGKVDDKFINMTPSHYQNFYLPNTYKVSPNQTLTLVYFYRISGYEIIEEAQTQIEIGENTLDYEITL